VENKQVTSGEGRIETRGRERGGVELQLSGPKDRDCEKWSVILHLRLAKECNSALAFSRRGPAALEGGRLVDGSFLQPLTAQGESPDWRDPWEERSRRIAITLWALM